MALLLVQKAMSAADKAEDFVPKIWRPQSIQFNLSIHFSERNEVNTKQTQNLQGMFRIPRVGRRIVRDVS